jgi:hypothetical protein
VLDNIVCNISDHQCVFLQDSLGDISFDDIATQPDQHEFQVVPETLLIVPGTLDKHQQLRHIRKWAPFSVDSLDF